MGKWEEEEKGWFEEVGLVIPPTSEPPIWALLTASITAAMDCTTAEGTLVPDPLQPAVVTALRT
jgi:hypothetical protein